MCSKYVCSILLLVASLAGSAIHAQEATPNKDAAEPAKQAAAAPAPAPAPAMTMKEAKQKLGIVVFPAKNQTPEQQEADELACLQWAANEMGIVPNAPAPDPKAAGAAAAAQTDEATKGAAVKGGAKGAAAGAIIGAIAGDAGTGAAIGAGAGAVAGKRARKGASAQADAATQEKLEAEQKAKVDGLRKAMGACLEPKGYTIK